MSQLDLANPQSLQRIPPPAPPVTLSFADAVRKKVGSVLVGKKADQFVTDLVNLTNQDMALKKCDPTSLVASALQAQSLNLSLSKALGQAWIVPFKDNKNKVPDPVTGEMVPRVMATFQIGYKGYIQLAIRSGYYRKLNVLSIKEGELRSYDPLNEEIDVALIQDEIMREQAPTIGYYAMFEYINGFRKCMYWGKGKMAAHADKYSPAFSLAATNGKYSKVSFADYEAGKVRSSDMWQYSSFWYKDFDAMAYKTMLRQILTKWGIMSIEMQQAYETDMRVISENEGAGVLGDIVDTDYTEVPAENDTHPALKHAPQAEAPEPAQQKAPVKKQPAPAQKPQPETPPVNFTVICPTNEKHVDELDCPQCPSRPGCPAWE